MSDVKNETKHSENTNNVVEGPGAPQQQEQQLVAYAVPFVQDMIRMLDSLTVLPEGYKQGQVRRMLNALETQGIQLRATTDGVNPEG